MNLNCWKSDYAELILTVPDNLTVSFEELDAMPGIIFREELQDWRLNQPQVPIIVEDRE